jgi:glycosyltransferase involved in cell wall biosynthesis
VFLHAYLSRWYRSFKYANFASLTILNKSSFRRFLAGMVLLQVAQNVSKLGYIGAMSKNGKALWAERSLYSVGGDFALNDASFEEVSDCFKLCKKPLVSVWVITYNHECYIAECLDSILAQQSDFEYEVLVGEDCSSDKTREICFAYQRKYPDKVRVIFSRQNVGMASNIRRLIRQVRGKYIAGCEGDDFWLTTNRLQEQVWFLNKHPAIQIVGARTKVYASDKTSKQNDGQELKFPDGKGLVFSHVSTWLCRKELYEWVDQQNNADCFRDMPILLHVQSKQQMILLEREYSVYRPTGAGVWSSISKTFDNYIIRVSEYKRYKQEYPQMAKNFVSGILQIYFECLTYSLKYLDAHVLFVALYYLMGYSLRYPTCGFRFARSKIYLGVRWLFRLR